MLDDGLVGVLRAGVGRAAVDDSSVIAHDERAVGQGRELGLVDFVVFFALLLDHLHIDRRVRTSYLKNCAPTSLQICALVHGASLLRC